MTIDYFERWDALIKYFNLFIFNRIEETVRNAMKNKKSKAYRLDLIFSVVF